MTSTNKDRLSRPLTIPVAMSRIKVKLLTSNEKMILALIGYFTLSSGKGLYSKNEIIADFLGLSTRAVTKAIGSLKKKGYIRTNRGRSPFRNILMTKGPKTDQFAQELIGIIKADRARQKQLTRGKNTPSTSHDSSMLTSHDSSMLHSTDPHVTSHDSSKSSREYDTESKIQLQGEVAEVKKPTCGELMLFWNDHPTLPGIRSFTTQRQRALATRLKDKLFADNWQEIIDKLARSPFHTGQGKRGWKADIDWLLKNGNFVKVLELEGPEAGEGDGEVLETHDATEEEAERLMQEIVNDS